MKAKEWMRQCKSYKAEEVPTKRLRSENVKVTRLCLRGNVYVPKDIQQGCEIRPIHHYTPVQDIHADGKPWNGHNGTIVARAHQICFYYVGRM